MPNLVDQMNMLRGLSDQSLSVTMGDPSGGVPQFLVLSEINRRKDMRDRTANAAAQQRPATTVAQDELSSFVPAGTEPGALTAPGGFGSSPGASAPMGGIDMAPPDDGAGYRRGGIVGYASGGSVGLGIDYGQIADQYSQMLEQQQKDRERAPWLALLAGGAAAMSGTSPNALTNIGQGISAGLGAFEQGRSNDSASQLSDLKMLSDLQQQQQGFQQNQQELAMRQQGLGLEQQKFDASQDPNNIQNEPSSQREFEYLKTLGPDQQEKYLAIASPYMSRGSITNEDKAAAAFNSTLNRNIATLRKQAALADPTTPPDEDEIRKRAWTISVTQFRATNPQWGKQADAYAAQDGYTADPANSDSDPLGLGL